jgi:hypothetical protein
MIKQTIAEYAENCYWRNPCPVAFADHFHSTADGVRGRGKQPGPWLHPADPAQPDTGCHLFIN